MVCVYVCVLRMYICHVNMHSFSHVYVYEIKNVSKQVSNNQRMSFIDNATERYPYINMH